MASVWGELKRRNVVKVAVAYAVVGWLLIQIADVAFPALLLPEWTLRAFIVFVALGFPIAVVLAWVFDLTPSGVQRTQSGTHSEGTTILAGRKLDFAIIGLLALAVGFMFVDSYLPESGPFAGAEIDPVSLEPAQDAPPVQGVEELIEPLPNSVAVLPLENLSPDPDNAYFAAGMHEEILNQLAKLRNLNVISRTSVLQYTEDRPSIPVIAADLNVQAILEGSVRFDGESVLIQAQLIDAATDSHLWSERYERELAGVFAIQADVAMNIANALQAEFSDLEQESIEQVPTSSPAAYSLYLRALSTGGFDLESTIDDLDNAIALDPQFALAYAYKALELVDRGRGRADVFPDWESRAEEAAARAASMNPNLAWAHVALGGLHHVNWRFAEAQMELERAYELNPNDTYVLNAYVSFKRDTGQLEDAERLTLRIIELDPSGKAFGYHSLGLVQRRLRNYEAAAASFRRNIELNPGIPLTHQQLARTLVVSGDYEAALQELEIAEQLLTDASANNLVQFAVVHSRLGREDDRARLLAELNRRGEEDLVPESTWAELRLADGNFEQARRHVEAAIAGRELEPGILNRIKENLYRDPVLEEPEWLELRAQIHPLN